MWILRGNEPVRYSVELGLSDDTKTQIISNEIQEKDKVIIGIAGETHKKKAIKAGRPPF